MLFQAGQDYINKMVTEVPGMKILIVDVETIGMISAVYSQSQILQKEVFLVEKIAAKRERMPHLKAVFMVRATQDNFKRITQELSNPLYGEYHLFFTNFVNQEALQKLAEADEQEIVRQVQEFYLDYYVVSQDMFTLAIPSTMNLLQPSWNKLENSIFDRMSDGIMSALLSLRKRPTIRFARGSEVCRQLADHIQSRIEEESQLFDFRRQEPSVLLILDRRDDPVTPLLNQWTYQAMVHELMDISNHRVDMKKFGITKEDLQEIVLSPDQDAFYRQHMISNFGELAAAVKELVDKYQVQSSMNERISTIEDMQHFVDRYPEFRKMAGSVSKHVALLSELSNLVERRLLLDVSKLEQEIACTDSRQEHYRGVAEKLQSPSVNNLEKLRLVLLYALRYESDPQLPTLKEMLRGSGVIEDQIKLVDAIIQHAGSHVRGGDLFGNRNFLSRATSTLKVLKGVPNVYTQHRPVLATLLEQLLKGKLSATDFPSTSQLNPRDRPPQDVIVFIVGGATFEEGREVTVINNSGQARVVLGGSTVHNSKSFLADLSQRVPRERESVSISLR
eukprot:GILI01010867.1.p1 GENE.GILI01010867.1~~GILI01010867.1.p1  ORF type:complete len:562 (+),score=161.61 GILI01010867.1:64-1749(+)